MLRILVALAFLVPSVAHAKGAKKKKPNDVEIWPPPDPATTDAEGKKPKSDEPPQKDDTKSDGDVDPYKLDPALKDSPPPPKPAPSPDGDKPAASDDDDDKPADDDACSDKFDDCKEDCTIAHTNDDDLHVKGKLPIVKCVQKCQKSYDRCEEQQEAGFPEKERDTGD